MIRCCTFVLCSLAGITGVANGFSLFCFDNCNKEEFIVLSHQDRCTETATAEHAFMHMSADSCLWQCSELPHHAVLLNMLWEMTASLPSPGLHHSGHQVLFAPLHWSFHALATSRGNLICQNRSQERSMELSAFNTGVTTLE